MTSQLYAAFDRIDHGRLMRRAIEIAATARRNGNDPFGALLADADGRVVLEAENTAVSDNDVTAHAERVLMTAASRAFTRDERQELILYTSTEPCAMCAGAIFFTGVRAVVYGLSADALHAFWAHDPGHPPALLDLSCRSVFASCAAHPTWVMGPLLEDEASAPHADFWSQRAST